METAEEKYINRNKTYIKKIKERIKEGIKVWLQARRLCMKQFIVIC